MNKKEIDDLTDWLIDREECVKEYKINLTQKQSIELLKEILNKYEVRGEQLCLLKNAIENILSEREQNKKRIKELEEENEKLRKANNITKNLTKKVKDLLTETQEEYNKVQEQFDCIWNKKSKDNYDRYKLQELSTMQQELGFILGKLEKILEDK